MATIKNKNCQDCKEEDDYDDMVSCDSCKKWTHFCCAGVKSDIKNQDWICSHCEVKKEPSKDSDIRIIRESVKNLVVSVKELTTAIAQPKLPDSVCGSSLTEGAAQENGATKPKTTVQQGSKTYELSKVLPCKTLEALDGFHLNVLKDESLYYGLVAYIEPALGNDIRKGIKNALDLIVHKDVQNLLSWSGLRTKKPSFEKCYRPIVNAMDEALKKKFKDYEYTVLANKIRTLLQTA